MFTGISSLFSKQRSEMVSEVDKGGRALVKCDKNDYSWYLDNEKTQVTL